MLFDILEFYKKAHFSGVLKFARYTFLAIFGDGDAEVIARRLYDEVKSQHAHPLVRLLIAALKERLNHQEWHQKRISPYLIHQQNSRLFFSDNPRDPAPIAQIKKIIHIFQLAQELLQVVEQVDITLPLHQIIITIDKPEVLEKIFELFKLLMTPDINLLTEFQEEFQALWVLVEPLLNVMLNPDVLKTKIQNNVLLGEKAVYQLGQMGGTAVRYLDPKQSSFQLLTQFKISLPAYLQMMIESMETFLQTSVHAIRRKKTEPSLEHQTLLLLHSLEQACSGSFFRPALFGDLVNILKFGHALTWRICYENNQLGQASEAWVKTQLKQFKLDYVANLLIFLDKFEEKLLLLPGWLTNGVQEKFEHWLDLFLQMFRRFISLSCEEQSLIDSMLIEKRLDAIYSRRAMMHLKQLELQMILQEKDKFFSLLAQCHVSSSAQSIVVMKQQLSKHYQLMRGHVMLINQEFDTLCRSFLSNERAASSSADVIGGLLNSLSAWWSPESDVSRLLDMQSLIEDGFAGCEKTLEFERVINADVLANACRVMKLFRKEITLKPIKSQFISQKHLKFEHLVDDYLGYLKQYEQFLQARDAYWAFKENTKKPPKDHYHYQLLREQFALFRILLPTNDLKIILQDLPDIQICKIMACQAEIEAKIVDEEMHFKQGLLHYKMQWIAFKRSPQGADISGHSKYTSLSHFTHGLQKSYTALYGFLNEDAQHRLKSCDQGLLMNIGHGLTANQFKLPFHEINDFNKVLIEPKVTLWVKRLANLIAHISTIVGQFEALDTTQLQASNVIQYLNNQRLKAVSLAHIMVIEYHIRHALLILLDIWRENDVYVMSHACFNQGSQTYDFIIQAIVLPIRTRASSIVQRIDEVFREFHSLLRCFLQLPHIIDLLLELQAALSPILKNTHQSIVETLQRIERLYASILINGDAFEEKWLLKEGLLTEPLGELLVLLAQGFIENLNPNDVCLKPYVARLKALHERLLQQNKARESILSNKEMAQQYMALLQGGVVEVKMLTMLKHANAFCQSRYLVCAPLEKIQQLLSQEVSEVKDEPLLKQLMEIYLADCERQLDEHQLAHRATQQKELLLQHKIQTQQRDSETQRKHVQDTQVLAGVKSCLLQLKFYFDKESKQLVNKEVSSAYETKDTLLKKLTCLRELEQITEDASLSIDQKLSKLKSMTQKGYFKNTMLAYHHYRPLSFQWLCQCVYQLLEWLSLYTPPLKKVYQGLVKAVACSEKNAQFSLFSPPKTALPTNRTDEKRRERGRKIFVSPAIL